MKKNLHKQQIKPALSLNFKLIIEFMLKRIVVFVALATLFVSCKKASAPGCPYRESNAVAPAGEIAAVQAYCASAHPGAIQHSSGLFYEIINPGTGSVTPGVCSTVTVKYTGTLTNTTKFDENQTGVSFTLGGLILGWQKGIPLIKKGGIINLYIPPSLGYGSSAAGSIPGNSILVFTVQLVDVQ